MFWLWVGLAVLVFLAWMWRIDHKRRDARRDVASGLRQGGLSQYGYPNPHGGSGAGGSAGDGGAGGGN